MCCNISELTIEANCGHFLDWASRPLEFMSKLLGRVCILGWTSVMDTRKHKSVQNKVEANLGSFVKPFGPKGNP